MGRPCASARHSFSFSCSRPGLPRCGLHLQRRAGRPRGPPRGQPGLRRHERSAAGCRAVPRARAGDRRARQGGRTSVPAPPQAPGRRVFLAFYRSDGDAVVATANGARLADAVASAAEEIAGKVKDPTKGRLELDVPTGLSGASIEEDQEMPIGSIGLEGILLVGDDGKTAAVLPGEIVERRLFHTGKTTGLSHDKLAPLLATRAGLSEPALPAMRRVPLPRRRRTSSRPSHGGALPVLRGMVAGPGGGHARAPARRGPSGRGLPAPRDELRGTLRLHVPPGRGPRRALLRLAAPRRHDVRASSRRTRSSGHRRTSRRPSSR